MRQYGGAERYGEVMKDRFCDGETDILIVFESCSCEQIIPAVHRTALRRRRWLRNEFHLYFQTNSAKKVHLHGVDWYKMAIFKRI